MQEVEIRLDLFDFGREVVMILGVGELLWDRFPDGTKVAGGAPFNFVFHCQQLGHQATIVSRLGNDSLGQELRAHLRSLHLDDSFIQDDDRHPTGTVDVELDAAGVPHYRIAKPVAWDFLSWNDGLAELATRCTAICFGTLAQRSACSRETILRLVRGCHNSHRIFDVNLRQNDYSLDVLREGHELADCLKISSEELPTLIQGLDRGGESCVNSLESLLNPPACVLMTCGSHGARIVQASDGRIVRFDVSGVFVQVVDTVGAGDAFAAAYTCLSMEGKPPEYAMRFANLYAAKVCARQGGTPVLSRLEIEKQL